MPLRTIATSKEKCSANLDGNMTMMTITTLKIFLVKLTHVQSQSVTGMEKVVYMELVKLHSIALVKLAGRFTELDQEAILAIL